MNLSWFLTTKASPVGSQDTMDGSSRDSISISFRGKGLEPMSEEEDVAEVMEEDFWAEDREDELELLLIPSTGLVPSGVVPVL